MGSLNRVLLIGNLTRDPEIRYTPKGTALTEIGLAINRVLSDEDGEKREEVTFVDLTLWGRLAEVTEKYLKKGSPVFIEGRLQLDSWDDKQTGQKRSRLRVVAESLQFLGGRTQGGGSAEPRSQSAQPGVEGSAFRNPITPKKSVATQPSKPEVDENGDPTKIPF